MIEALGGTAGKITKYGTLVLFPLLLLSFLWGGICWFRRGAPRTAALTGAVASGLIGFVLMVAASAILWNRIGLQYFSLAAWVWPLLMGVAVDAIPFRGARAAAAALILSAAFAAGTGHVMGKAREDVRTGVQTALEIGNALQAENGQSPIYTAVLKQPPYFPNKILFQVYAPGVKAMEPKDVPPGWAEGGDRPVIVFSRKVSPEMNGPDRDYWHDIQNGRKLKDNGVRVDAATSVFVFCR